MSDNFTALKIEKREIKIVAPAIGEDLFFLKADISEGLSELASIEVEFLTDKLSLDSEDFLGEELIITLEIEDETTRAWKGVCVECLYIGESAGMGYGTYAHYRVQARSWPWLLTRTTDCKIFQNMKTEDIIKQVFDDAGYSEFRFKTDGTYNEREYCVQYHESDFAFICRLMEEEGMFYRFEHEWVDSTDTASQSKVWLEILDDSAQTEQIWGDFEIKLMDKESGQREEKDFIHKWEERKTFDTGAIAVRDYNFTTPKVDMTGKRKVTEDKYSKYEKFEYHARYQEPEEGEKIARRKLEAITAERHQIRGVGLVKQIEPGKRFGLKDHPNDAQNKEFMAVRMLHKLRQEKTDTKAIKREKDFHMTEDDIIELHEVIFTAQPVDIPYKTREVTPWPTIHGIQTAVVVGPEGEEIYTDNYGRVKIQFHWDREGEQDDKSSCWIRVMTPMAGKNWGLIAIPRIGQEVVVQFEEGDPDRPLVIGMVYNEDNPVPMGLPDNKTQLGFRTDCHKNDDGEAFHEFILEDSKDGEFIRMQSEKDYEVKVKNNTKIEYGTGDKDDGSLKLDVWKNTEETFGVGAGEGSLTQKVQDNFTKNIIAGDYTLEVESGERSTTIATNETLSVGSDRDSTIGSNDSLSVGSDSSTNVGSNMTIDVGSEFTLSAGSKITLQCGASKIVMTTSGIEISAPQVTVKGTGTVDVKSPKTTVKGDGLLTLQGGLVKIN